MFLDPDEIHEPVPNVTRRIRANGRRMPGGAAFTGERCALGHQNEGAGVDMVPVVFSGLFAVMGMPFGFDVRTEFCRFGRDAPDA